MCDVRFIGIDAGEVVLSDFGRGASGSTGDTFPATRRCMSTTGVIVHETDDHGLIVAERQWWNMPELSAQPGMFVPISES